MEHGTGQDEERAFTCPTPTWPAHGRRWGKFVGILRFIFRGGGGEGGLWQIHCLHEPEIGQPVLDDPAAQHHVKELLVPADA